MIQLSIPILYVYTFTLAYIELNGRLYGQHVR